MDPKKKTLALILALLFLCLPAAAWWWPFGGDPAPTPEPGSDLPVLQGGEGAIRVYLKSLGQPEALGLTLLGSYALEGDPGFRFDEDSYIAVAAAGEDLLLSAGGLTINMGAHFTLTAHSDDAGIRIAQTDRDNLYGGDLKLANEKGAVKAVLTVDVEEYLYGVLPYEMSDSFPMEALKAQAVAARTYALSRRSPIRDYDVVDTTGDQVYRGKDPDMENSIAAVDATRGVAGYYKGGYATCYFTASNGGQTELPGHVWGGEGDYGYLAMQDDPYDLENPNSVVKSLDLSSDPTLWDRALQAALREGVRAQLPPEATYTVKGIASMAPADPKYGADNRMFRSLQAGVELTDGRLLYVNMDFYGLLKDKYGLKINDQDWEVLSVVPLKEGEPCPEGEVPDAFRLESRRFGHGVGMSQRGAQCMAGTHDKNWVEILNFYYPGMELVRMEMSPKAITSLEELPEALGYARVRPTPKPTPAPLPKLETGEYYARVALSSKGSSLNVRERPAVDAPVVGQLDHGQRLIVTGEKTAEGWLAVKTAEVKGYSSAEFIQAE